MSCSTGVGEHLENVKSAGFPLGWVEVICRHKAKAWLRKMSFENGEFGFLFACICCMFLFLQVLLLQELYSYILLLHVFVSVCFCLQELLLQRVNLCACLAFLVPRFAVRVVFGCFVKQENLIFPR